MKRLGQKTLFKRIMVGVAVGVIMLTQLAGTIVASAADDEASEVDKWMSCAIVQTSTYGKTSCTYCSSYILLQNTRLLDEKWQFGEVGKKVTVKSTSDKNAKGKTFDSYVTSMPGGFWGTAPISDETLKQMTGGKLKQVLVGQVKEDTKEEGKSTDQGRGTSEYCITGLGGKYFKDMSEKELVKAFKTIYDAGYFAIVGVGSQANSQPGTAGSFGAKHVSLFAGVSDSHVYISDVWDGVTLCPICASNYGSLKYAVLYKADGTSPKELAGGKVTVKSDTTENADGTVTVNGFWDESGFYQEVKLTDEPIVFPTFEELSNQDKQDVRAWKDDLEFRSNNDYFGIIRGVVAFLGIVLVVYSTLLYLAYQFDCINNIVDIQMLSILTLGRLRVSPDNEKSTFNSDKQESKSGEKVVVHKDMIIVCLIGIAIGVLLLSGKIYALIGWVVKVIKGWLK